MKSMVLYASRIAGDRGEYTAINSKGETLFVRCETVELDMDKALTKARPRDGETVLNSIPLD